MKWKFIIVQSMESATMENFQFQENAIVQWVLELQGEALDMYGI